jgi:pyruvate carboxylase subunit B
MKYTVTVGDHEFEVDVNGSTVTVDGRETGAKLHRGPGQDISTLELGPRSIRLTLEPSDDGWIVRRGGDSVEATVVDERDRLLQKFGGAAGRAGRDGVVKAPMPGLVLRIAASEGTTVEAGQGLLVLEAMKMENEIRAPVTGVVGSVMVSAGQAVEKGTPLLEVVGNHAG